MFDSPVGAISKKECQTLEENNDESALIIAYMRVNELLKKDTRGVSVKTLHLNSRQLQKLISSYENQGWKIKRDTYDDFRESWDNLEFS
jgi:hypothetical protein